MLCLLTHSVAQFISTGETSRTRMNLIVSEDEGWVKAEKKTEVRCLMIRMG